MQRGPIQQPDRKEKRSEPTLKGSNEWSAKTSFLLFERNAAYHGYTFTDQILNRELAPVELKSNRRHGPAKILLGDVAKVTVVPWLRDGHSGQPAPRDVPAKSDGSRLPKLSISDVETHREASTGSFGSPVKFLRTLQHYFEASHDFTSVVAS